MEGRFAAGISGGADSMCLLSLIIETGREKDVTVLHIDHGIREESANDRLLVEKFCARHGIAYRAFSIDVPALSRQNGNSIETEARMSRHQIFDDFCADNDIPLMLAHNKGDNVETILMHIFRGCGLRGLVGMSEFDRFDSRCFNRASHLGDKCADSASFVSDNSACRSEIGHLSKHTLSSESLTLVQNNEKDIRIIAKGCCKKRTGIIRPLLSVSKSEIYDYVKKKDIPFSEDFTNKDVSYRRNHIRALIPEIEKSFASVQDAVLSLSGIAAKTDDFLQSQLDPSFFVRDGNAVLLSKKIFGSFLESIYVIQAAKMVGLLADLEQKHVESVCHLVGLNVGKSIDLPHALRVYNEKEHIAFEFVRPLCYDEVQFFAGENRLGDTTVVVKELKYSDISTCLEGNRTDTASSFVAEDVEGIVSGSSMGVDLAPRRNKIASDFNSMERNGNALFVDADKLEGAILRFRRDGDKFHSCGGKAKNLKEYLNGKKIPNRRKSFLPLIARDSEILVICGLELSDNVKITDKTKRVYEIYTQ